MCLGGNWNGVFCDTIPLQSSNSHAVHLVGFKHLATVTRFKCSPSSPPPLDDSFDPASSVTISLSQLNLAKFILSNFICFDWKIIFYFCTSQACGGKSRALYIYIYIPEDTYGWWLADDGAIKTLGVYPHPFCL
jgi:hypothetical protein